jgi:hypothetical protein
MKAIEKHQLDASHRMRLAELYLKNDQPRQAVEILETTDDLLLTRVERDRRDTLRQALAPFLPRAEIDPSLE